MLVMSSRRIACSVKLNFATTTPKKGKRKRKKEKSAVTLIRSTRNMRETPTSGEAVAPDFGSGRWAVGGRVLWGYNRSTCEKDAAPTRGDAALRHPRLL